MFDQLGLDSRRLKLEWIDKDESTKLQAAVDNFVGEMAKLGPITQGGFVPEKMAV